jgi:magnesium chelatase family protein
VAARERQWARFSGTPVFANAQMDERMVESCCPLDARTEEFLLAAMRRLALTARGHHRILKVARTLADLEGLDAIASKHLAEAIQYRTLDRQIFGDA